MADYPAVQAFGEVVFDGPYSGGDTTPPTIGNISPALGSTLQATDPISFDLTDNSGQFALRVLLASAGALYELVHDGTAFSALYSQSTVEPITNGYRYTIRRNGGWRPGVPLKIRALVVDDAGNLLEIGS